jgi:hypothetical protein
MGALLARLAVTMSPEPDRPEVRFHLQGLNQPHWAARLLRAATMRLGRHFRELTRVEWLLRGRGERISVDCELHAATGVYFASAHATGIHDPIQRVVRQLVRQRRRTRGTGGIMPD